jgi:photosynthetic reaction center cytochrome c subunit
MKDPFKFAVALATVLVTALATGLIAVYTFERPPVATAQYGYRGLAMEGVSNPRLASIKLAANKAPEALDVAPADGDRASEIYENVKVLGHLSVDQFGRIMQAMTEWVYPGQGCNGCHAEGNFAAEDVYQKQVARRMIQMVQHINSAWKPHVGETGVTCYTCHRGNAVPTANWSTAPEPPRSGGILAIPYGQNVGSRASGYSSLTFDPFTPFLLNDKPIRVTTSTALRSGNRSSIEQTEWTFSLMMHMSQSLGVNCTFCHNSSVFNDWADSTPQRVTAWHGIRMTRDVNANYIEPLKPQFPAHRLGPLGDTLKANCETCHAGVNKPLYGAPMIKDYPELLPAPRSAAVSGEDGVRTAMMRR